MRQTFIISQFFRESIFRLWCDEGIEWQGTVNVNVWSFSKTFNDCFFPLSMVDACVRVAIWLYSYWYVYGFLCAYFFSSDYFPEGKISCDSFAQMKWNGLAYLKFRFGNGYSLYVSACSIYNLNLQLFFVHWSSVMKWQSMLSRGLQ